MARFLYNYTRDFLVCIAAFFCLCESHSGEISGGSGAQAASSTIPPAVKAASPGGEASGSKASSPPEPVSQSNPPARAEMRIDASSSERLQESFINMMMALPDSMQQKFASAMTTLGLVFSQRPELGGNEEMLKLVAGKTADEIIAEARRLTPYLKQHSNIIDGRSADAFGQSVASVLVSLDTDKQTKFSEALAKLMYDFQKKGKTNEDLIKKLDGKTPEEVLEMAREIDAPFVSNSESSFKEFKLAPLSDEEVKKLKIAPQDGKSEEESLDTSLAPNSIFE